MRKSTLAVFLVPAVILLIPLVAMRFTTEVVWTLSDFIIMYLLMTGVGGTFHFIVTCSQHIAYRAGAGIACGATFLLTWANLAVGVIGSDDNPVNGFFFLIPFVGLLGAALSRFAPRGMARTAFIMAAVQMAIPVGAFIFNRPDFSPGVVPVFVINAVFAGLFTFAGLLFQYAHGAGDKSSGRPDAVPEATV